VAWSERAAGDLALGVLAAQQQRPQPVDLPGPGGGELLAGTEQDPQCFAVTVSAGSGQPIGVQTQRGQDREVGIDRVRFSLATTGRAVRLLTLDDEQASGGDRAGQPGAVAAGPLDRHDHPGTRRTLGDPRKQLGIARAVVADGDGGDRCPTRVRDLHLMRVAMGIHPPDSIDDFCQHEHVAWCPFLGVGSPSAPAWMGTPSGTSVTGHANRRTGF
jgi:hypothetical protein